MALGVIVLDDGRSRSSIERKETTYVSLAGVATDLWEQKIDTERRVLVHKVILQRLDLRDVSGREHR